MYDVEHTTITTEKETPKEALQQQTVLFTFLYCHRPDRRHSPYFVHSRLHCTQK